MNEILGQSRNFLPGPVQTPDGTFHGKDGFGDVLETKERTFPTQSAPEALVKIFNEQKGIGSIQLQQDNLSHTRVEPGHVGTILKDSLSNN